MTRAAFLAGAALALVFAFRGTAWAEGGAAPASLTPARARLRLPACPFLPFDRDDLIATLRVELLDHGTELQPDDQGVDSDPGAVALVSVDAPTCVGTEIRIRVADEATGQAAETSLGLSDRALEERARILALAIAELLRSSWRDLHAATFEPPLSPGREAVAEPAPPTQVAPAQPGPDLEALRREAGASALEELDRRERLALAQLHAVRVTATLQASAFPMVHGGLLGVRAGASLRLHRRLPLRLDLDLGYGFGGASTQIGDIDVHSLLGGVGLLFDGGSSRVRGVVGPRLELGWGWAIGAPEAPGVLGGKVDGFVLSVVLDGGVHVRLATRLWLLVHVIAGWTPVSLEPLAEGLLIGGIGRAVLGARIGLAVGI